MIGVVAAFKLSSMTATRSGNEPSDDELAARVAQRGHSDSALRAAHSAFDQLYQRHARLLYAFLANRARESEIADPHQDVWRRVWQRLPDQYQARGEFRPWLHEIARRALIDRGRKKQPQSLGNEDALIDHRKDSPDAQTLEHERMKILKRCVERLGAEAAALVKGRLGGENYAEICKRLRLTPAQAHKLWHKVKRQIQDCVERTLL